MNYQVNIRRQKWQQQMRTEYRLSIIWGKQRKDKHILDLTVLQIIADESKLQISCCGICNKLVFSKIAGIVHEPILKPEAGLQLINFIFPLLVFHKILFQQVKAESQNSRVINLAKAENPVGDQINGADYIGQGEYEDDNRSG